MLGSSLLIPGLLEPRTVRDMFPKAHIEHQILVAEQESRERALPSPVQPAPSNLHNEGGSRPEEEMQDFVREHYLAQTVVADDAMG